MTEESTKPPKVFISYAWEDDVLPWVKKLARRLRDNGVETVLDQWETEYGDQLPEFMERAVRDSDFVILICTPKYKKKSNEREGGVGYEGHIITAEIFEKNNQRKFIPVLRKGGWGFAAPSWAAGKLYIDLSGNPYKEENYRKLLRTLLGKKPTPPPVGPPPDFPDDDDDMEQPTSFARFFVTLKEVLSKSFTSLKSTLPKVFPFLRIVGFIGIGIALLWGGSLAIPKFIALIPTAKASVASPTNTKIAFTKTPVSATKTLSPNATPTKTRTPTPISLPTEITDAKGVSMALVPAGEFTMGGGIYTALKVNLGSYYIDKFEVTNAEYQNCVLAHQCDAPVDTKLGNLSYYGNNAYDSYPVVWVTKENAEQYCGWRGTRLPTSEEWEKAARGTDQRSYPWGNQTDIASRANGKGVGDGFQVTAPVGSFPLGVSPYGVYDMAGNVSEFISDNYVSGSTGSEGRPWTKGGDWYGGSNIGSDFLLLSSGANVFYQPNSWTGFRCVREANP